MHENFIPLVFFTVLCQTAAGSLIFRELIIFRGGFEFISEGFMKRSLLIIGLFLSVSLVISFLHLGYPMHAFSALNNLGKSWLSREILSLSLLMISILIYFLITLKTKYTSTGKIFSAIPVLLSISLIYSMIRLYMIPSVYTWDNPFTPVSFLITTLLCGILLTAMITGCYNNGFKTLIIPLIALLIIASIADSILFTATFSEKSLNLFIIRCALTVVSLLITAVINFRRGSNKTFILWVILSLAVLASEIINRFIFFLSFEKSGL